MILRTEHITTDCPEWTRINELALEAFPPEEYLSPSELVRMAQFDGFDFLALYDEAKFIGFMVVKTYKEMAYLFS